MSSTTSNTSQYSPATWINKFDQNMKDRPASTIVRDTVGVLTATWLTYNAYKSVQKYGVRKAVGRLALKVVRCIPGASSVISGETSKTIDALEGMVMGEETKNEPAYLTIPIQGVNRNDLKNKLLQWKSKEEAKWNTGKVSGCVYHGGEDLLSFLVDIYGMFALSNPLHPDVFPFVRKMEAEVVRMSINLFNGDEKAVGATTSGGTESILMAMKAYRDQAAERGIEVAEIIAPITAHAAFDKAAHYFGMKLVHVPVDPITFKADVNAVRKAVNKNTVVIVGSAPSFPQGTVDPITQLSDIAIKNGIGLHVDCCLGGFLLPFVEKLGYEVEKFDFRVPGVTSISADTHKYGYAPKGSSVIMYRSSKLRSYQYFVAPAWTGGIYASPAMPGSRPGGLIAATWAALVAVGQEGYLECAKAIMEVSKTIEAGVRKIDGLKMLGRPDMSVICFTHDPDSAVGKQINIFKVAESMSKRGWNLNSLQNPSSVHLCCTYLHRGRGQEFLKDLQESVDHVREHPELYKNGSAAIYGMAESIPDGSIIEDLAKGFIDVLYKADPSTVTLTSQNSTQ